MSFLAGTTYEAVMVPILADFHPDSVMSLVNHSESVILFTDNEIWSKLKIAQMPAIKAVISSTSLELLYGATKEIEEAHKNIGQLLEAKYPQGFTKNNVNYPDGNDKELAIINYTSGTTSSPKGVMLRYECVSANVEFGQNRIPSGPNDRIVSMLPMAHMYGLMFELIYPLCGGSSIYYIG
jgi:long-chain acyl-CoA synthetase